ncbi:MAG: hypothetical protein A3F84_02960 [Candidatus Handelsmanbacteria bacterium RIFCSPLOWO2_12_FULL_64_10]|uniref:Carbohydrate kinase FGGY N-terminal domain-containing protein n=1 Tax=Handelsmanbacteria sp. (strain RIFCSPLOWO2_12_FULL_64_10) TaxID=1817868 RepID=A0A1F6CQF6_HANXR|nr:MAG: hypothetical protein A3F84_02960 [Candidatus Handelsmanbacteria bacterium RIFCSPLOWO2_12_FULL_64_10]
MGRYLGLDVGTTTITALALDAASGEVVAVRTVPNACEVTSPEDRRRGRSEWDAAKMVALALGVIREAVRAGGTTQGIGVTGQMHGTLLVSEAGAPVGPFIGWQDRRGMEAPDGRSYVERIQALADELGAGGRICKPRAGYLGTTLFWMAVNGVLPRVPFVASFLPDYIVASLTGARPVTDATDAAGSGLFDVFSLKWEEGLIGALGLSRGMLPEAQPSGSRAGGLTRAAAAATGLPEGLPVCVACGDNQASFAGSVGDYGHDLLVNIGTGGQVSAHVDRAMLTEGLEARPYVDGKYLLVGAGLVGGRSYAWLRDVFREIGRAFFGGGGDEDLYDAMNRLAAAVPPGCEGLRCEPLFTGTRREPDRRGVWSGVGAANFTPGHLARALLEGIAEQFRLMYGEMERLGAGGRTRLIGAGNGVRKNPLLREILADAFGMRMQTPAHREEAAFGAALLAAVGDGAFSRLQEAGKLIRYE